MFIVAWLTNIQRVEATQVSIDRRMDKQNEVNTYNGMLFCLKEEENSDTCYHRNELWEQHYVKWNEQAIKGLILYTYMRSLEQSEL